MTALNLSAIPSGINTYERLLIWAAWACQSIANGQAVNVAEGQGQVPIVQVQVGVTADNVDRYLVSAYLPVDRDAINSSTSKAWMATQDISTAAPHSNFLSN